jgi:hypothetical protein
MTLDEIVSHLQKILAEYDLLVDLEITQYPNGVWFAAFATEEDEEGDHLVFGGHGLTPVAAIEGAIEAFEAEQA